VSFENRLNRCQRPWHKTCLCNRMSTLSWSLYRDGSEIAFRAGPAHSGYAIAVTRDGIALLHEQTSDGSSLLCRSTELRESFQHLGYTATPHEEGAALLAGPCWGPGTPLPAAVIAPRELVPLSWEGWNTRAAV
jgi:hypothetical protein